MFSIHGQPLFGLHTRFSDHNAVDSLFRLIDEGLIPMGINALILEFNPGYSYRCFPEYSNGTVIYEDCVRIRDYCRMREIEVIPLFQCLSHQSDNMAGAIPWNLLKEHPEFDETPEIPTTAGWPEFYLHSWCASNDDIYQYVFPMMDELIDAFDAQYLHIGMDEVFEIAQCSRCRGKDPAVLFARTVKIVYDHLKQKSVRPLMWGDRLLNAEALGYQMWEADKFGMYPAFDRVDEVARDIVITDWHYDLHDHGYPSVPQFMKAGFDVVPSFGCDTDQALHFAKFAMEDVYMGRKYHWPGRMSGFLFTQWAPLTPEGVDELLDGLHTGNRSVEEFSFQNVGCTIKAVSERYREMLRRLV